jgi:DNA-directed RNA polymerase subunit RPC12/RpoP
VPANLGMGMGRPRELKARMYTEYMEPRQIKCLKCGHEFPEAYVTATSASSLDQPPSAPINCPKCGEPQGNVVDFSPPEKSK